MKKFKTVLVLGGGGVMGLAHIGVLKGLKEARIPIDLIVGTSMGAIIGAAYCLGQDLEEIEKKVLELINQKPIRQLEEFLAKSPHEGKQIVLEKMFYFVKDLYLWNLRATKEWLVKTEPIVEIIKVLIGDKEFSEVKTPFICVATDLKTGKQIILREGNILMAVIASSAVPGVFAPVKIDNHLLVDGGVLGSVPIDVARGQDADFVIAVDVEEYSLNNQLRQGLDILLQVDQMRLNKLNNLILARADFLIKPDVGGINWADFSKANFCIQKGKQAIQEVVPILRKNIAHRRRKNFLRNCWLC